MFHLFSLFIELVEGSSHESKKKMKSIGTQHFPGLVILLFPLSIGLFKVAIIKLHKKIIQSF